MSFFNSLQQYVSSGVANLTLSPKRFSLSREGSSGGDESAPSSAAHSRSGSLTSSVNIHHGYPKVVPLPGAGSPSLPRLRRKTLECTPVAGGLGVPASIPRRVGSFRHQRSAHVPLMFCRRRQSWPEFDNQATSGVQETDGSFFESFTALSWKQENRRLSVQQEMEERIGDPPTPPCRQSGEPPITSREMEALYIEVLYTIKNKIGASIGQYANLTPEELFHYAQHAFDMSPARHRRLLAVASEEKPPILVLNAVVIEAENLEAKDANGYSDPYCMLGIQPGNASPISPQPQQQVSPQHSRDTPPPLSPRMAACRALSDSSGASLETNSKQESHNEKLRKHHSFRLSFKRRDTLRRDSGRDGSGRDTNSTSAVPAKYIRATSVKPYSLNPRWNEKFRFDIDDISSDILHLDIWDHDDESSVLDAVSRLNEVRGVKGLGRFFKQIAQSARSGSQDDFLGCVNVPLQDIPSTGLDCWYRLEARTQRSNIQGRIRLKLWLSTREDRGTSEEDNWTEIHQEEQLHSIFINYELSKHRGKSWEWSGDLPQVAQIILHQHAIQGDITDLQLALVRWVAYSKITQEHSLDPKILFRLLQGLDQVWGNESLSKEQEDCLAESFTTFVEHSLYLVKKHRHLFPPQQRPTMTRFDYLLRCLGMLASMKAFRKCCPFHKEIRSEIILALKKGTAEWYEETSAQTINSQLNCHKDFYNKHSDLTSTDKTLHNLTHFIIVLLVDLQIGLDAFNPLFEQNNSIPFFTVVYKQLEKMVTSDMASRIAELSVALQTYELDNTIISTSIFELYFAIQEFASLKDHIPPPDHKTLSINGYHEWFEPALEKWFNVAKNRALSRIRAAFELSRMVAGDRIVKHSTSAVDTAACFFQVQEFWRQLQWPDMLSAYDYVMKAVDIVTSGSLYYSDLVQQKLQDSGYYENTGPFKISDEMCVSVNDLEYVRRSVNGLANVLNIEAVLEAVENADREQQQMGLTTGSTADSTSQWREALYGALEETQLTLEARALQVISKIGIRLRPALKKCMFHLAWSPDSLPTAEAVAPLLELLDGHLISLNAALLPRNFERVLADLWDTVLLELGSQVDSPSEEKVSVYYDRLHEALQILVDFFHAEEKGLPLEMLKSATYFQVEQRISYHRTPTDQLILKFYQERLEDQLSGAGGGMYGVLTVRVYFNHDSLCMEILHARDVIPLDPNGFSDPFVIIELLPRKLFAHCAEQQTNVHKKTLNPVFDECFEFPVTLDQCRSEGAMILFTVMDHDVLTANDFAGEAFLSLQTIPGVATDPSAIDHFHGLKPQDLFLMQQTNRNHPILQILETRVWDRTAQEFVRKQKLRFAMPS